MTTSSKSELIKTFDPNGPGKPGRLFGLPFDVETADLLIIPVPWEVTVSYRAGTADGPAAVLEASAQVDLFIPDIPDAWQMGIAMLENPPNLAEENRKYRDLALSYINWLEAEEGLISEGMKVIAKAVDELFHLRPALGVFDAGTLALQLDHGHDLKVLAGFLIGLGGELLAQLVRQFFLVAQPDQMGRGLAGAEALNARLLGEFREQLLLGLGDFLTADRHGDLLAGFVDVLNVGFHNGNVFV